MKKILGVIVKIIGIGATIAGLFAMFKTSDNRIKKINKKAERSDLYYKIANQWLLNIQAGRTIKTFFDKSEIKNIAIYGMGSLAEILYNELKNTDITVKYYIDQCADTMISTEEGCNVIGIDEIGQREEVDAIIVTPVFDFDSIADKLKRVYAGKVISLDEVIFGI